jgi:uncharacterized membrane protein
MQGKWLVFGVVLAVFLACDAVWLALVAKDFYQAQIGQLMLAQPRWGAAALFYPIYAFGLVFFCVSPALARGTWITALTMGALFGLVAYGTYDLSNLATLKGWPAAMTVIDMLWGTIASAIATTAGYFAGDRARRAR